MLWRLNIYSYRSMGAFVYGGTGNVFYLDGKKYRGKKWVKGAIYVLIKAHHK